MEKKKIGPFGSMGILLLIAVLSWGCQADNGTEPDTPPSDQAGSSGATVRSSTGGSGINGPYAKEGFVIQEEEGRLWVLRPGEEKSEKHVTLVGAGPEGMTLKALDKNTALEYLACKPGFHTEVEKGRLWVLRPDEEKSEKHVTLVGAGPLGVTLKALDRDTALEYIATRKGFHVEVEDGRIWVFRQEGPRERSEKHVTRVGAGPMGTTLKALDRETLDAYLAAKD